MEKRTKTVFASAYKYSFNLLEIHSNGTDKIKTHIRKCKKKQQQHQQTIFFAYDDGYYSILDIR